MFGDSLDVVTITATNWACNPASTARLPGLM